MILGNPTNMLIKAMLEEKNDKAVRGYQEFLELSVVSETQIL